MAREGEIAAKYRWVKRLQGYALRAAWTGHDPVNLEVGWGGAIRREKLRTGDSVTIPVPMFLGASALPNPEGVAIPAHVGGSYVLLNGARGTSLLPASPPEDVGLNSGFDKLEGPRPT
jgi:hypothetical protein